MRILILLILFISCKGVVKEQDENNIKTHKIAPTIKKETVRVEIEQDVKKDSSAFKFLENKKIVGLSVRNKEEKDLQKKYWIDFSSICMCDSPSFFIDTDNKQIYLFNYCRRGMPPKGKEPFYSYAITSMSLVDGKVEIIGISDKQIKINLIFEKITDRIYKLHPSKNLPTDYIGGRLNEYFTTAPQFFQKEDCGDFDG